MSQARIILRSLLRSIDVRHLLPILFWCIGLTLSRSALAQSYTILDLGTVNGNSPTPSAINASGKIVGTVFTGSALNAVLWQNGTLINLATPHGSTDALAYGINDNGLIVGG